MSTVAQIKAAARKLPVKDRADLLNDFSNDAAVRKEQLSRLRAEIAEGIRDHADGRYIEVTTPAEHRAFFAAIKRRGRARTTQSA